MAKKTKSAKKAAKVAKKAAKKAEKSKTKVDRRSQLRSIDMSAPGTLILSVLLERPRNGPVKCRTPPKTSTAKPSIAPPGPPVPLRGHCETSSKSSPIRL